MNRTIQETIYINDGALPYYEYSKTTTTKDRDPLYLESDCSDDNGHRGCGLKVAFSQKGLVHLSFLQTDNPNYFPELEF